MPPLEPATEEEPFEDSYSWIVWGVPVIVCLVFACCLITILLLRKWIRGPMYKGKAVDMTGKTVVITGANTGIGKETAKDLAKRGAKIIMLCRNTDKANAAAEDLRRETNGSISVEKLDLSSFESIRDCAQKIKAQEPQIHVLINNAGVSFCPQWETADGLEMQIGTNHFGHFLLTLLLIDNIKAAAPSRIVVVSSLAHKFGKINFEDLHSRKKYDASVAYNQSKLANVLFAKQLAKELKGTGVTTSSLHPGVVATEIARHMEKVYGRCMKGFFDIMRSIFFKDAILGAQTSIACAVDIEIGKDTGKYYNDCKTEKASKNALKKDDAEKLWKISLETVGLNDFAV